MSIDSGEPMIWEQNALVWILYTPNSTEWNFEKIVEATYESIFSLNFYEKNAFNQL